MKSVMWLVAAMVFALTPMAGAQRAGGQPAAAAQRSPGAGPIIVFETAKGTFEMETYPNEAPKSVAHILTLVRRNFYHGLRVHRVEPGFVVQFGDPRMADSQMYVTLAPTPRLDRDYTVFGQVISGMDVVAKIEVGDVIRRATVKAGAPATK